MGAQFSEKSKAEMRKHFDDPPKPKLSNSACAKWMPIIGLGLQVGGFAHGIISGTISQTGYPINPTFWVVLNAFITAFLCRAVLYSGKKRFNSSGTRVSFNCSSLQGLRAS